MDQRDESPIRLIPTLSFLVCSWGCAPTLDVAGVYFPGWLVSAIAGVAISYGIVVWLARRPGSRNPAGSGLLFSSLSVGLALAIWWVCFRSF
jgi:hypothetical protein